MAVGDMNDAVLAALQRYVPQVNPLASASTDLGMSRTTLNQLTNPSILAGTGVFSEEDLARLMGSWMEERYSILDAEAREEYNDAVEKWEKDAAKALEDWQKENDSIRARYAASPEPRLVNSVRDTYRDSPFDPYFAEVEQGVTRGSELARRYQQKNPADEWKQIFLNQDLPESEAVALANTYNGKSQYDIDKEIYGAPAVEDFVSDIQEHGRKYANWVDDVTKWKQNRELQIKSLNSELAKLGDKPTAEQAPDLADFAPKFNTQKERQDFFDEIGLPGLALLPNPMEPYQFAAGDIMGDYPTAAEQALQRYADDPNARTLASRPVRMGDATSDYAMAEAGVVGAQAPTATGRDVAEDILARQRARRTEGGQAYQEAQRERTRASLVADLLNRQMTEADRTPFGDAMANLYGYGRSV